MAKPTPAQSFHLRLPETLYRQLQAEAARANLPATAVARNAIESWLRHQRRAAVREAIAAYAAGASGSHEDLDLDPGAASLEALRPEPRTRRR